MADALERTSRVWDRANAVEGASRAGVYWLENAEMQRYANRRITGDPELNWMSYCLSTHFSGRLPLQRCLSLACGAGRLERSLGQLGAFRECDAYDIARESIALAKRLAAEEGLHGINYEVRNINELCLHESSYDAVFIDSGAHHFSCLEAVFGSTRRALRPGGLLVMNEYVGPNRFQFPPGQKEIANSCLNLIPMKYRTLRSNPTSVGTIASGHADRVDPLHLASRIADKLRDRNLISSLKRRFKLHRSRRSKGPQFKMSVDFPTARDVEAFDPSEAVRSQDIIPVLRNEFEIIEMKGWGGNILQFLLVDIAGNFTDDDPSALSLLHMLENIEETLVDCRHFESDFAFIVARAKRSPEAAERR